MYDEARMGWLEVENCFLIPPEGMLRKELLLQQSINIAWSEHCKRAIFIQSN